jgi:ATP-dependent protease HslVU (ClpYQ) peptidase subunit
MTTIAYRDGIIASDSQATQGIVKSRIRKMWKLSKGILAVAGDYNQGMSLLTWMVASLASPDGEEPGPPDLSETGAFFLTKKGLYMYDQSPMPILIEEPFYAIGSGQELALGAMTMGASAKEAVKVASKWDVNTGGRIVTMSL